MAAAGNSRWRAAGEKQRAVEREIVVACSQRVVEWEAQKTVE